MKFAAIGRWARLLVLVFLIAAPENAQGGPIRVLITLQAPVTQQAPLTLQELLDLRALGFGEGELRAEIDRTGTRLTLSAEERGRLERAGFTAELIAHLTRGGPDTPRAPVAPGAPRTLQQQVVAAYGAPAALMGHALTWTQLGAEAVFIASRANGGQSVVKTGTLTQIAPGRMEFEYTATPADRLHIAMKDGTSADYYVTAFQGDLTSNGATLLNGAHEVALRVAVPGTLDLTLTSRKARNGPINYDGVIDSSARGTMLFDGVQAEVELRATGTYYFETDFEGTESRSDLRTLGTVRVGAQELRLDERWESNMISGMKERIGSGAHVQEFVSSYIRTVNSTWTAGATSGAVRNAVIRTAFRDGAPSTTDERYWTASGEVLVDGEVVGSVVILSLPYQHRLLVTTSPQPIELQVWATRAVK